jgi:hypothetical protein
MKSLKISLFGMLLTASMFVTGCADQCKDVACVNGECTEGDCICTVGYEGLDCSVALNAKFAGSYSNSESCSVSGTATYAVTFAPKTGTQDEINITGLWESPQAIVTGHVEANGLDFHIERTVLGTTNRDIEATSGTISANGSTITLTYTIYNGTSVVETCTASFSK